MGTIDKIKEGWRKSYVNFRIWLVVFLEITKEYLGEVRMNFRRRKQEFTTQIRPRIRRLRKRLRVARRRTKSNVTRFMNWTNQKGKTMATGFKNWLSRDWIFNPITWFGFLAVYGLAFGGIITGSLWVILEVLHYFNVTPINPLSGMVGLGLWSALTLLAFVPDFTEDGDVATEEVPQTFFIALVTIFGMVTDIGRKTGNYPCTGRWVGLGRSTAASDTITNPDGFVHGGAITFPVWQSASAAEGSDERKRITEPAKNSAELTARITLILERVKPRLWLNAQNAGTEVGNAARQAYLEFLTKFNDTDAASIVGYLHPWMMGDEIVVAFTPRQVREFKAGSLLRDSNGRALITLVKKGETAEEAIERFKRDLLPQTERTMRMAPDDKKERKIQSVVIKASRPVRNIIEARGYRPINTTMEGVVLSRQVTEEANKASSETFQADAQKRSAEAQARYRERLGLGPDATASEQLAAALAFAQDHPDSDAVRVVIVPGGTDISKAAAVIGTNPGGNKP